VSKRAATRAAAATPVHRAVEGSQRQRAASACQQLSRYLRCFRRRWLRGARRAPRSVAVLVIAATAAMLRALPSYIWRYEAYAAVERARALPAAVAAQRVLLKRGSTL
jgi:hypothetical protein